MRRNTRRKLVLAAVLTVATAVAALSLMPTVPGSEPLPVFPEQEPAARKQAFFDYLRPIVRYENEKIRRDREWLLGHLDEKRRGWLDQWRWQSLARKYRVPLDLPEEEVAALLLRRVAEVPESLVLAQAAKESGWGRSRFAIGGNAIFGQRCFTPGCGMVPANRVAGARHEVKTFDTVADSVASYLRNLNTHQRYARLRRERQKRAEAGLPVYGSTLAPFATDYSERRGKYVNEIIALIEHNKLEPPATAYAD